MIAPATNQQQLENGANAHESLCNDPIKEIALRELCSRTGYQIKQENGQRKYGGPPPGWNDVVPGKGCELFVGKLPRDLYEDELVPVLEKCGSIYELRLMMDFNGNNRGFAFVKYTTQNEAKRALRELNNHEIRKGRLLGVCKSVDNCRLFVGGIPKTKQKEEILVELQKLTEGVVDVIVYPAAADKTKNRGFAFVEFQDHHTAAMARRKLMHTRPQVWGHPIAVDWAEPEVEVDDDVMSQVKILYVRNLMLHTTEEQLEKEFTAIVPIETIERVKKIRDYGFVHFNTRDNALKCMKALNGKLLDGAPMEVTLAKPVDRETYVRYTRANNRAPTEAPDALPPQFPGFVTAAYDPRLDPAAAAAAAYYPGGPIYFGGIPSYAAAPLPAIQQVPRYPMPAFRGAGVAPVSHMGMAQIGAAGVPLGIPGATTGVATAPGGRGATGGRGGGRNRSHNQSRSVAGGGGGGGGRNYVNVGGQRGFQTTYYNQYNRRPTWQPPHHQQQQQVISVQQAPAEKYDLQPGMELTPINPLSLKPNQQKSSVQLLEEYCMKVGLEKPAYKLHSTPGPTGQQLFLYRVELLNSNSRLRQSTLPQPVESPQPQQVTKQQPSNSPKQQLDSQYTPTKLCTSLDMAQEMAAEHVLTTLQGSSAPEANDHNGEVYITSDSLQSMTLYNGAASGEADPQSGYNAGYTVYSNVPYAGGIVTTYG